MKHHARMSLDVVKTFNDVVYATIYGQIIIAIIQGTLGGIGFYIFGISSPVFWGIMMTLFSLVPFIGSSIIWAPTAIYLFISGLASSSNPLIFKGVGLFIFGLLIISILLLGCAEEEAPVIGGERDEHGCLGPAGYTWNEEIGACIR